jgi:MoaE-MoaD fusion protein
MRLAIRLFAALRERAGATELLLEDLPEPLDVTGLKRELVRRHPELGNLDAVRGVVDTTYVSDDTLLVEGVEVSLLPPVSGGAPTTDELLEEGVFELVADDLDPLEAQREVAHPSCGAVLLFTGFTRETNRDRSVVELDYEAFARMVGPEMARIFTDARGRFGRQAEGDPRPPAERRLRMLVRHRTGVVPVGEPSIVIAVASPHRDTAYSASRFLIDEIKNRLPVWKKEVYTDGHHWVGEGS